MNLLVKPSAPLRGTLILPGDKSISHRAVIFGCMAHGVTTIENLLEAEDVLRTVKIFKQLGVDIKRVKTKRRVVWKIKGKGLAGFKAPRGVLYCGNSGTTMRLMMGLLSGLPFKSRLTGDDSLNRRPMDRVVRPLMQMGADIRSIRKNRERIIMINGKSLHGMRYRSPVASAQVKSALLLAGLTHQEKISVQEPVLSRDHTERMLAGFGVDVARRGLRVDLGKQRKLRGQRVIVPGDPSSAAFFVVSALINPHATTQLKLRRVGLNPTRIGFLTILEKMGGTIKVQKRRLICGEPVGDLVVKPCRLHPVSVQGKIIPSLIDEIPILTVAMSQAAGTSSFQGVGELRVKETDRIETLQANLPRYGIDMASRQNSFWIKPRQLRGNIGKSFGDHRIAMSLAILGTVAPGSSWVMQTECIKTSFPQFFACLQSIGVKFKLFKRKTL